MKKIFTIFSIALMMFASCSKVGVDVSNTNTYGERAKVELSNGVTYISVPEGVTSVVAYNYADGAQIGPMMVNDGVVGITSDAPATVELYSVPMTKASAGEYIGTYLIDGTAKWISIDVAAERLRVDDAEYFRTIFAAGVDNVSKYSGTIPDGMEGFGLDFLYKSNGLPFSIYPIYSLGWYDLQMGIFYYDENAEYHEVYFWDMINNHWGKETYTYLSEHAIKDVSKYEITQTDANGFTIQLPKGVLFGFFVDCHDDAKAGKYSTYRKNNAGERIHAASFIHNNKNYLGFEDQDFGDNDLNDLICYISPKQETIVNPTITAAEDAKDNIVVPSSIPETSDKIIHITHDDPEIDVETRLMAPYYYLRINVPIKNGDNFKIDLSDFENMVAPKDDVRIVIANDVTIADDIVTVVEDANTISVKVNGTLEDGERQLKIELRPIVDYYQLLVDEMQKMLDGTFNWEKLYTKITSPVVTPTTSIDATGAINNFITKFPENGDNWTGEIYSFSYVSNGQPFKIYPLYSNTSNKLKFGMYYIDNLGVKHDMDVYEMDMDTWYNDGTKQSSRQYHYLVSKTNPTGYEVTVPDGCEFGFYVYTTNTTDTVGKYTDKQFNTCESSHKTHKSEGAVHATTYNEGEYTYLGFDDGHSNTADFNDWIFIMKPAQTRK